MRLRDTRKVQLAAATTPDNPSNQYDYTQLTSGRVVLNTGDFAVHTKISLNQKETKLFSKTEYTIIEIESIVSDSSGKAVTQKIRDEFKIQLAKNLPHSLSVFSQETRG